MLNSVHKIFALFSADIFIVLFNKEAELKPPDLIEVPIKPVVICWFVITKLEIDLNHINFGLDSITRSYKPYKRSSIISWNYHVLQSESKTIERDKICLIQIEKKF